MGHPETLANPSLPIPSDPLSSNDWVIETSHLNKTYVDFWGRPKVQAVIDLNLKVKRGEIFGLLGPNGSGKTTTTKLLLGLIFPTSGTMKILGHTPGDIEVHRRIGFLPEESYLYRFLNAEETLSFYGNLFELDRTVLKSRVQDLIQKVGLEHAKKRRLKEYSKGMSRRIGLATALINNPELVFLDEPTSGLDPMGREQVKNLLITLKQEGKTVLVCSHLLADIEDICDRIAIMKQGRMAVYGTVSELLTHIDITRFSIKDLAPEELQTLKNFVTQQGKQIVNIDHPRSSLEALFQKTILQDNALPPSFR
ncbi:MAG: ABC transporter ATP-binding protein [Planctomycetota bacterium]